MDKFSALKYYYGYDTFKEGQAEVIDQLLDGRDALCIMPERVYTFIFRRHNPLHLQQMQQLCGCGG